MNSRKVAFQLSCSCVFRHNHPSLQKGQVCHKKWKNLEFKTQKKLQKFFQQHFRFEARRLGFGIVLLLIALFCWGVGGILFGGLFVCLFTLILIYTRPEFKEFKNKSWDLNIVMKYCCLAFWMERTEECCMS